MVDAHEMSKSLHLPLIYLFMSTGRGALDLQGGGSQTFAGFCFFFFLTSRADSTGSGICSYYG